MYLNNLIFREVETVLDEEKAMDRDSVIMENNEVKLLEGKFSWDQLVSDIDSESDMEEN